ncbi:hypothetical protein PoB_000178000 [Plakobranchus ocellatus]|uniref:Uncharacterized protein n=1 Tax=Plakobranchus ocellatus TaxID=259542 RepID=A0AAV3XWU7_9GAST|nr:hypothetical protein PoB_000178000 [Plakobranchus ocellatus]
MTDQALPNSTRGDFRWLRKGEKATVRARPASRDELTAAHQNPPLARSSMSFQLPRQTTWLVPYEAL